MVKALSEDELEALQLDAKAIQIHQQRIMEGLKNPASLFVPIEDTCRLDNGGILPQRFLHTIHEEQLRGLVAFVPAAGAASRYLKPFADLHTALSQGDDTGIAIQHEQLLRQGARVWPLPPHLKSFLAEDNCAKLDSREQQLLLAEIELPKALLPFCKNGPSFLHKKRAEHAELKGLLAEYFVAPIGQSAVFAAQEFKATDIPCRFVEQGPALSTLRFYKDGRPFRSESGALSLVPAGHGMLVKLFDQIRQEEPAAHSLFIRNIDNVPEEGSEPQQATKLFLLQHQTVLLALQKIRQQLSEQNLAGAAEEAQQLLENFVSSGQASRQAWIADLDPMLQPLWMLLIEIFQCPERFARQLRSQVGEIKALLQLYQRPLNSLGQVPNSGRDVGGTPVFTQTANGRVSLCLELPHATEEDRRHFLEDSNKATHFNPVFVAAEIPASSRAYDLDNCPFWILAEKSYHGQTVVYHETVLYEVIGNSQTANLLFPTIPRCLFHPHKTLADGAKELAGL